MSLGGVGAGLVVALLSGLVTRLTPLREDASFAAFYLISLALGVLLVSTHGSNVDLLHDVLGVSGIGHTPADEITQPGSLLRDDLGDLTILLGHPRDPRRLIHLFL
jgi:hypothetical protein